MNLRDRKFQPLESNVQAVLFNDQGAVIESDDSIVKIEENLNVYAEALFFQGMEETLAAMSVGDEIKFNCINTPLFGYQSNFDFIIQRILNDDSVIFCWLIFDFVDQYQKILELQQERNVRVIESQKLERNQQKITKEKDAIERLYKELKNSDSSEYILLKSDSLMVNIDIRTIEYFEASGDYVKVNTAEKTYVVHNKMKNLEKNLPQSFFRVHRSFIVQLSKIRNIEQMSLDISGKIIPIGQSQKADLLSKMNRI